MFWRRFNQDVFTISIRFFSSLSHHPHVLCVPSPVRSTRRFIISDETNLPTNFGEINESFRVHAFWKKFCSYDHKPIQFLPCSQWKVLSYLNDNCLVHQFYSPMEMYDDNYAILRPMRLSTTIYSPLNEQI